MEPLAAGLVRFQRGGWEIGTGDANISKAVLDLIITSDPYRQQVVARRIEALLRERGFGEIYDGWDGKIDQALGWDFPYSQR
jgi:hypothetical protein